MKQDYKTIDVTVEKRVCHIVLNRPEVRNAFNPLMIQELQQVFDDIQQHQSLSCVTLQGRGDVFCSGADLNWMKESRAYSEKQNKDDAARLFTLFNSMDQCPIPLIAIVQGYIVGGGMGFVSVCDYVISTRNATFSLSEVKLGLVPAVVGPFVLKKMGESWTRALFLTAKRFQADLALRLGFIHEVCDGLSLCQEVLDDLVAHIVQSSPNALRVSKKLIHHLSQLSFEKQQKEAINTLATIRVSDEAQEGIAAFLEKRKPRWFDDSI